MAINPSLLIVPYRFKAAKLYSQLPESGAGDFVVTRSTTATRTNASGLLESVASGVPRLDYTGGGCPSLLVEPAATNLLLRSQEFDNASWAKVPVGTALAPVVTANASVAPNGTTTADRVVFNTVGTSINDRSILRQSQSTADLRVGSIWLKSNTGSNQTMSFHDGVLINLITVTNEWQRFNVSIASDKGFFGLETRGNTNPGIRDVLVWGAQLETGSVATSYIPTVEAAVTRNADLISLSSVSGLIGQTQGTIYAEVNATNFVDGARIFELSDTTANNNISLRKQSSSRLRAVVTTASGTVADISTASGLVAGTYKIAIAYAANDFVLYVNGAQIGADTSGAVPATSKVNLGSGATDTNQANDGISAAAIYTSRLLNSELASLTSL